MIRKLLCPLSALFLMFLAAPGAFGDGQSLRIVTGAGMVMYDNPACVKPGLWVEYRIRSDGNGVHGEALQKLAITGFELYRGERCMWVETEYTENDQPTQYCRVLVSTRITRDPHGRDTDRIHDYARKIQTMVGRRGDVQEMIFPKVVVIDSTNSRQLGNKHQVDKFDTLAVADVSTDAGHFRATPIRHTRTVSFLIPVGPQGSKYHYQNEEQTSWISREVPLTNTASQLTISKYLDAAIPTGATVDAVTRTMVMPVTRTESQVIRFGTGAVTAFPKDARVTRLGAPPTGEVEPLPSGK